MSTIQVKITLTYKKATKGTFVYEDLSDGAPIPTLYIRKHIFPGLPPQKLILELNEAQ